MRRTKRASSLSRVTGTVGSTPVTWEASTNRVISLSVAEPRRYSFLFYVLVEDFLCFFDTLM